MNFFQNVLDRTAQELYRRHLAGDLSLAYADSKSPAGPRRYQPGAGVAIPTGWL
jgi:hypothetical protein